MGKCTAFFKGSNFELQSVVKKFWKNYGETLEHRNQYFEILGEILEYGKILQYFLEYLREILQNVKVGKTWVTLGKKNLNIWKFSKKLRMSFEEIKKTFRIHFLHISVEILCNFQGNFKKLKKNCMEIKM